MSSSRTLLLIVIGLVLLAAAPAGGAVTATPSVDYQLFLPLVSRPVSAAELPPATFLGADGSPIDGLNGSGYYPGKLDQNLPLRAKSFEWLKQAGINYFRSYGSDGIIFSWKFTEPSDNVFDWDAWDTIVKAAQQEDISLLLSIGNAVPSWANGSASYRDKPLDLWNDPWENTSWYHYVRTIVERYDGDGVDDMPGLTKPVKYYELWNEPDLRTFWLQTCDPQHPTPEGCPAHQFNGTVEDYVRLTRVGYDAVKDADPAAQVIGPATAQAGGNPDLFHYYIWNWEDFTNAGGTNYVDAVSFTRYMFQEVGDYTWDYDGANAATYVDLMLDHANNTRGGKPIWLTETGWPAFVGDTTQYKAITFVRFAVIAWQRTFVDRFFWYSWHETQYPIAQKGVLQTTEGTAAIGVEPDPLVEPLFRAMDIFKQMTANYELAERPVVVTQTPASRVYKFEDAEKTVWVAWHRDGSGSSVVNIDTGGRTVRVVGLFGEDLGTFAGGDLTLNPRPIYLTTQLDWNPNQGHITGRVCDGTRPNAWNNGIANATIVVEGPINTTTTTDEDGNFVAAGLPDGVYTVSVQGYTTVPVSRMATVNKEVAFGRTSFRVGGSGC